jgi:hypothetical protein
MPIRIKHCLAQSAKARLLCGRIMRLDVPKLGAVISTGALIVFCSCEEHHLGELPPVQKERTDLATSSAQNSDVVKERPMSPEGSPNPAPAEFFPSATPR